VPVPSGTNAAHLRTLGRGALLLTVVLAPVTLMWPSIEGWTALGVALAALLGLWLIDRSLTENTRVPGHWMHLALMSLWLLGTVHMFSDGMTPATTRPRPLAGQFEASLVTQAGLIAVVVLLAQDWLAGGAAPAIVTTAAGLAAVAAALLGLLIGTRSDSDLMLAMMGWTGAAMICLPLAARRQTAGEPLLRRVERRGRLGVAVIAAAALSVLYPPSVVLVMAAAAATLLIASALIGRGAVRYLAVALLAGGLAAAGARDLGWLPMPAWPRGVAGWVGHGGEALSDVTPWTSSLALLNGTVGAGGVAWLAACLLIGLALAMRTAIRDGRHGRALLGGLTLVLVTTAWLAPGGLFSPGINVLFAALWALGPAALGRRSPQRRGWRVVAVAGALSIVLALVGRMGLLSWMAFSLGGSDTLLHLFVGWLVAQMLLWLLSGRPLAIPIGVGLSVLAAAAGEVLQAVLSTRSAQWRDFIGHLVGTALAAMLYLLARLSLWSESRGSV